MSIKSYEIINDGTSCEECGCCEDIVWSDEYDEYLCTDCLFEKTTEDMDF